MVKCGAVSVFSRLQLGAALLAGRMHLPARAIAPAALGPGARPVSIASHQDCINALTNSFERHFMCPPGLKRRTGGSSAQSLWHDRLRTSRSTLLCSCRAPVCVRLGSFKYNVGCCGASKGASGAGLQAAQGLAGSPVLRTQRRSGQGCACRRVCKYHGMHWGWFILFTLVCPAVAPHIPLQLARRSLSRQSTKWGVHTYSRQQYRIVFRGGSAGLQANGC